MPLGAIYALIGKSLTHSASPQLFHSVVRPEAQPIPYDCFPLQNLEELQPLLRSQTQLLGLNVTMPYKQEVLKFVDKIDAAVAAIGAANTLLIDRKQGICAFNTDIIGVKADLNALLEGTRPQRVLILGTGGASKAVSFTLQRDFAAPDIRFASRSPTSPDEMYYDAANERLSEFSLLINTTPLGMYPDIEAAPPLRYTAITSKQFVWDLIYKPRETQFLMQCAAQGAQTRNGWGMLVAQARASLEIWESPPAFSQLQSNPWQEVSLKL